MKQFAAATLVGGFLALAASTASAAPQVERSGRTFHIRACPTTEGPRSARCFAHIVTDSRGNPIATPAKHGGGGGPPPPPPPPTNGYTPAQLRAAYGITGGMGTPGSGATVAIVDAYGYPSAATDLALYRSQFGLGTCGTSNGCLTIVNETGGSPPTQANTGWDEEQALDLDMVSTMCPSCKILLVEASSASFGDLATAVNTAAARAHVVSNSYGGGESGSGPYESAYNHSSVAITASTGDTGYGASFPATSPHVIAAGGTSLYMSGLSRSAPETAWRDGGSGCSTVYARLMWAVDPLCSKRMEADVSADADPNTGVAVLYRSTWLEFGGTSVAAPLIGGIYGEKGGAVNYSQSLYTAPASAFHDITSGSNGSCTITYYCTAGSGYDGPTGLGTPNGDSAF